MDSAYIAMMAGGLILLASMASVEFGLSVALIEIAFGVIAGNFLGLQTTPWLDFLASFAGIVLTFLAGAEVDVGLMRKKLKESLLIGGISFAAPFFGAWVFCQYVLGWPLQTAQLTGIALSTTSLAVVYAVLVETGLTEHPTGKLIMAATFVTDFGVAATLSLLFIHPNWWLVLFVAVSVAIIVIMPALHRWFFARYGNRVIEPEIKGAFAAILVLMYVAELAQSHAVLPAFILGLAVSHIFEQHREEQRRFRVVTFAFLTPFFFLKGGMNVSLGLVWANMGLLILLFAVKQATKLVGVYPPSIRYLPPREAMFTTLLMSTGLTFGTISSLYGLRTGIFTQAQFSVIVTVVVLSAIVPTFIAQRWFEPRRDQRSHAIAGASSLVIDPAHESQGE
ncbi:MAG TPA: cation:proton antiporter [Methylomirabilota bacterium]|nr:cation:proton antiporter [Methylomirabilota bacterium]